MLRYKINVIEELRKVGLNTTSARSNKFFAQSTMKKFRDGDTNTSLENLNRLCFILKMQPADIIEFVETIEDNEKYIL